ncbi:MAG: RimK family alpha-L-glutamate ligase [Anaerolineae bacterium]|nr:RimK family alpha-L-glutamate ligase [Anaerolineae bacterium]
MNIIILTHQPENYSNARLVSALKARDHAVRLFSPQECVVKIGQNAGVYVAGDRLNDIDVVLPRCAGYTWHGINVLKPLEALIATQLKLAGAMCINDPDAKLRAHNKCLTLQLLAQANLPVPATVLTWNFDALDSVIEDLGSPTILKMIEGTWGVGVVRADSPASLISTFDTLKGMGRPFVLQKYIADSAGKDIRAFVIGEQIIAAMSRQAKPGDFRANIHRGGTAIAVPLPDDYARLAVAAAQTLQIEIAGVDMLETVAGPVIIEVNPSPGLEGIEAVTNIDIADHIASYLEQRYYETQSVKRKT